MTDSDRGTAVERRINHETPRMLRQPKISLVDSIKESLRKIGGYREAKSEYKQAGGGERGGNEELIRDVIQLEKAFTCTIVKCGYSQTDFGPGNFGPAGQKSPEITPGILSDYDVS